MPGVLPLLGAVSIINGDSPRRSAGYDKHSKADEAPFLNLAPISACSSGRQCIIHFLCRNAKKIRARSVFRRQAGRIHANLLRKRQADGKSANTRKYSVTPWYDNRSYHMAQWNMIECMLDSEEIITW